MRGPHHVGMALTATQIARKATLEARLTLIESAITATLTRGVKSYSTEIQSLTSLGLDELKRQEDAIRNELARLNRGCRFGRIGFVGVDS